MRVSGIFLGIFCVLSGCSSTVDSGAPDQVRAFNTPARELAACVFERLDKAGDCEGLRISDYPTSGEARIACQITAGVITTAATTFWTAEFLPGAAPDTSTVRFWGMATVPGVRGYAERAMPSVEACSNP